MRRSQTELAVLGALSMQPMTAYAVREAIRDVLGNFWSESFGQIYPTLGSLEEHALVQRQPGGRRGSSVFSITDSGMSRLRELLGEPIASPPPRNGLLLRLFFGRTLGVPACRDLVVAARDEAQRRLVELEALSEHLRAEEPGPDLPFTLITITAGLSGARATIQWADEALVALAAVEEDQ